MLFRLLGVLAIALIGCPGAVVWAVAGDWPEFRGPTGQGLGLDANPPLEWGPEKNVQWRQALPGSGWSSPVVVDGRIYVTAAILGGDDSVESLRVLCLNSDSGAIQWNTEALPAPDVARKHPKNSFASPTSIVADGRIYAHFGPWGTASLDMQGTVVWQQTGLGYETPHGNGGSPVLYEDKLIFSCDDVSDPFMAALDSATGEVLWKTARRTEASKKFSFCTPLVVESGGKDLVVSPGSGFVGAYDPESGQEVWRVNYGEGFSVVPRPVTAHGLVYLATGFARPCNVLAIRTGGSGNVTDTHVAWMLSDRASPHTPSMLAVGDELYYVSDRGIFSCVDGRTGEIHWREELAGSYSASPIHAAGRIYVTSEDGVTTVVRAGKRFEKLAENSLGERVFASTACVGDALFIRSEAALYRIQGP